MCGKTIFMHACAPQFMSPLLYHVPMYTSCVARELYVHAVASLSQVADCHNFCLPAQPTLFPINMIGVGPGVPVFCAKTLLPNATAQP